jgi:hypothetical protein
MVEKLKATMSAIESTGATSEDFVLNEKLFLKEFMEPIPLQSLSPI